MWVWLDKITPDWMLVYRDSLAQPNFIPTTAVSYVRLDMPLEGICLCDRSPQQIACNRLPTMEFKSVGTLVNNKLRASFQTSVSHAFYRTLQTSKWMWKWNNQHVTSVGQRKTLSPRQDSNLWPPKHRAGALSTWATQPSRLKFLLGHHLATNSFGLGRLFYKSSRQLQNFRRHGD